MRVLYVAYPMLPVTESVPGGAEQMLWTLEREIAARGHRTSVAACDGSHVSGKLVATGAPPQTVDAFEQRRAEHEEKVLEEIRNAAAAGDPYDLVHDKSGWFWLRAREIDAPVLATLHLPRSFYPADAFANPPSTLCFNCVSEAQFRSFADLANVLGVIANGIDLRLFPEPAEQRAFYALWIGRICHEKGPHLAIDVAREACLPLVLVGDVYRFSYHESYFRRLIAPYVDRSHVHYVASPAFSEKVHYLRRARALLVTSLVEETSSLVAMEAMACGTPVITIHRGALREVVRDGVTGFVVNTPEEMVDALDRVKEIDPKRCREHVEAYFSATRMADDYEHLYTTTICGTMPLHRVTGRATRP